MAAEQKLEKPVLEKIPVPVNPAEKLISPEKKIENIPVVPEKKAEEKSPAEILVAGNAMSVPTPQSYQAARAKEIDLILSEGLNEIFLKMKPAEQKAFQKKGEEMVLKINELLNQTKVKINKIISLIREWLAMVTGINKFFIEQEVKIKADKIMQLKDK